MLERRPRIFNYIKTARARSIWKHSKWQLPTSASLRSFRTLGSRSSSTRWSRKTNVKSRHCPKWAYNVVLILKMVYSAFHPSAIGNSRLPQALSPLFWYSNAIWCQVSRLSKASWYPTRSVILKFNLPSMMPCWIPIKIFLILSRKQKMKDHLKIRSLTSDKLSCSHTSTYPRSSVSSIKAPCSTNSKIWKPQMQFNWNWTATIFLLL